MPSTSPVILGDETFSTWLSSRLAEQASLSGRADELASERRQGWYSPVLITPFHQSAFDHYLEGWLAIRNQPKDEA